MNHPMTVEYSKLLDGTYVSSKTVTFGRKTLGWRKYSIERRTAGYRIAGSAARWTDAMYAVTFMSEGASHGRLFKTLGEASTYFKNLRAI